MYVFMMLLIGFVVGLIAMIITPSRAGGVVVTVLVGIGGSVLAGFLARLLGLYRQPVDTPGIVASLFGAMLLLFLFRAIVDRRVRGTA